VRVLGGWVSSESDLAVLEDLEAKGQAFLAALEAARPVLSRLRLAAGKSPSTAGILERLAAHELDAPTESEPADVEVVDAVISRDQA
jgi:hypothetical protein